MPVTSPDTPELLTTTEAANLARVSSDAIRRAIRLGQLRADRRPGNLYLIGRADVEAWAKRREEEQGKR